MNSFEFGLYNSNYANLYIEKRPAPAAPERRKSVYTVAGRSDDVYEDEGCFNNITLAYQVGCSHIDENLAYIKALVSQSGYMKLKDTYYPDGYYRAFIYNPVKFTEDLLNFGHATIEFSADPYFYLDLGDTPITLSSARTLTDPTGFGSKPTIIVNGTSGANVTIFINSKQYNCKIPSGYSKLIIDCFNEVAYVADGSVNKNAIKYYLSDEFPMFDGRNPAISFVGATSMTILPKWRRL